MVWGVKSCEIILFQRDNIANDGETIFGLPCFDTKNKMFS